MNDGACAVRTAVPLAPLTTLGVGGPARWLCSARRASDVQAAHDVCDARKATLEVIGGGSNLVIADDGLDGVVLRIDIQGIEIDQEPHGVLVTAGAGEPWDRIVALAVAEGLAGIECLSGIPGTVGGTPIQNVGAYGQEVGGAIERLTVFDRISRTFRVMRGEECAFAYRFSRFKGVDAGRFVVCDVTFRLKPGEPTAAYPDVQAHFDRAGIRHPSLRDVRNAVLSIRRRKGMVVDAADPDTRSVGSFFMNPVMTDKERGQIEAAAGMPPPCFVMTDGRVKVPAAWLIERAGFQKGYAEGAVGISTKHPLAIVNRGGATALDVVRLAGRIKRGVVEAFGVALRPEPVFIGFGPDADVQYLRS